MKRTVEQVTQMIINFLIKTKCFTVKPKWEIKESVLGGLGVFAKEDIPAGDLIFKDSAVIIGSRSVIAKNICVVCFKDSDLKFCENNCKLPVCSMECQNTPQHQQECEFIRQHLSDEPNNNINYSDFIKYLTPIRGLLLDENDKSVVKALKGHRGPQHGFEVKILLDKFKMKFTDEELNFMFFVCTVLDANAFEVITGNEDNVSNVRGLFPLGSLCNHNCTPNACHIFDKNHHMVVKASRNILRGEEIFHSYTRVIWGTLNRRLHLLKSKHFLCKCQRCCDVTEFGSNISALKCKNCKIGTVLPLTPDIKSSWQCETCQNKTKCQEIGQMMLLLGSTLATFDDDDVDLMMKFLTLKLCNLVHQNNQIVVELKCKIVFALSKKEVPNELLKIKEEFCRDILKVFQFLQTGYLKLRALIQLELHNCLKEQKTRNMEMQVSDEEMKNLLEEVRIVLKDDVSTPKEVFD